MLGIKKKEMACTKHFLFFFNLFLMVFKCIIYRKLNKKLFSLLLPVQNKLNCFISCYSMYNRKLK